MFRIRTVFGSAFLVLCFACAQLSANLKYKQEVTITSCKSEQDSKEMVYEFLKAARENPNLKVVGIRYNQEKRGKDCTFYDALITCHVSQIDKDVLSVQEKILQNNKDMESRREL